jgi:hypothetical protein
MNIWEEKNLKPYCGKMRFFMLVKHFVKKKNATNVAPSPFTQAKNPA